MLAEATKQIFGAADRENDVLTLEDEGSDATGASEKNLVTEGNIPEWAQVLEPVRKLPTNVGTRIRKCVNEALTMNPPEWAKKILEHSISKEVYKGNASGPTKVLIAAAFLWYMHVCCASSICYESEDINAAFMCQLHLSLCVLSVSISNFR